MKRHIQLVIVILFSSITSLSAQDKAEKYCQVIIAPKSGFTTKRIAKISFGNKKELFVLKDSIVMEQLNKVNNLTSEVDVLNYMSELGWTPIDIHASGLYTVQEVIYFKKRSDSPEFTD